MCRGYCAKVSAWRLVPRDICLELPERRFEGGFRRGDKLLLLCCTPKTQYRGQRCLVGEQAKCYFRAVQQRHSTEAKKALEGSLEEQAKC